MGLWEAIKKKLTADEVSKMLKDITNRDVHFHFHIAVNLVQREAQ